jgi:hypothetical protein
MAKSHTVQAGDWIGAIAKVHGFSHWTQLWEHALNDALRLERPSPDLLMVGDEVRVPEPADARGVEVPTGNRVVFVVRERGDVLRLRIAGLGAYIAAFGPVDYHVEVGTEASSGSLTQEGQVIEIPLDPGSKKVVLTLLGEQRYEYPLGGLGPVEESQGAHFRLLNLGYASLQPQVEAAASPPEAEDPLTVALMAFQRLTGIQVTGFLNSETKAALLEHYGG